MTFDPDFVFFGFVALVAVTFAGAVWRVLREHDSVTAEPADEEWP
jgi:hypothetical protein